MDVLAYLMQQSGMDQDPNGALRSLFNSLMSEGNAQGQTGGGGDYGGNTYNTFEGGTSNTTVNTTVPAMPSPDWGSIMENTQPQAPQGGSSPQQGGSGGGIPPPAQPQKAPPPAKPPKPQTPTWNSQTGAWSSGSNSQQGGAYYNDGDYGQWNGATGAWANPTGGGGYHPSQSPSANPLGGGNIGGHW